MKLLSLSFADLEQILSDWVNAGYLRLLELELYRWLKQESEQAQQSFTPQQALLLILASHQSGRGHACLEYSALVTNANIYLAMPPEGRKVTTAILPASLFKSVSHHDWTDTLQSSWLVQVSNALNQPFVLAGSRLYLRKFWRYEQEIAQALQLRLNAPAPIALEASIYRAMIDPLFPNSEVGVNWQKVACALASRNRVTIITGGPGTGKTTTVVRLLALLQQIQSQAQEPMLRIRLAAPTGKAAARLNESIQQQIEYLGELGVSSEIRQLIRAEKVTTLHRLLGAQANTRHFLYHASNPLAVDVVVVDEASMIDVEMMANLMQALPTSARLVLLGDKDQLASVEAGAVLGELCKEAERGAYNAETVTWLQHYVGQDIPESYQVAQAERHHQAIVMLRKSHRFNENSGIGQLARAVNQGNSVQTLTLLEGAEGVSRLRTATLLNTDLQTILLAAYADYLAALQSWQHSIDRQENPTDDIALAILKRFNQFQVLCAVRNGEWGVESLNAFIESLLRAKGYLGTEEWYSGRPILITRNNYALKLMNGDVGIVLPFYVASTGKIHQRVVFSGDNDSIDAVLPSRLSNVETVFAMTVHKSQGSEFQKVLMVLPSNNSPILTRELLYTGITRAKSEFILCASQDNVIHHCVSTAVLRLSGPLWPLR